VRDCSAGTDFARVPTGRERLDSNAFIPKHRHDKPYAAIVLSGGYEECGSRGRFRVGCGDVLLHGPFDSHLDRVTASGAEILNLRLERLATVRMSLGHIGDADAIMRAAETDQSSAEVLLFEKMTEVKPDSKDWPDVLAEDLRQDPECRLDTWARRYQLAPETLSRGFRSAFGLTPSAFRAESRARCAFARIIGDDTPLSTIAAESGFADQSHMTRAIAALTGAPPNAWRQKSISFKTDRLETD
jgi:AraC-like DNA-binding protein